MARFFIDRPVFAMVIAIVIVILGAVAIPGLPISAYPQVVPPVGSDHGHLSGRQCAGSGKDGRAAHRGTTGRAGRHAVLPVHQRQQRPAGHQHHLQAGHQSGYRGGADAEPRERRAAPPATRSAAPGRDRQEGLDRVPDGGQPGGQRRSLRRAVPDQLRADQPGEPDRQPAGRGRIAPEFAAGLLDARLAEPGQDDEARHHRDRRLQRRAGAEPAESRGRDRPGALAARHRFPVCGDRPGPPHRPQPVRGHRRARAAGRLAAAGSRYRPRRTRRADLQRVQPLERQAFGQRDRLSRARRQRGGDGRPGDQVRGEREDELSRRASTTWCRTTPPCSCAPPSRTCWSP